MIPQTAPPVAMIDDLLTALDEQAVGLQARLAHMDAMIVAIVHRDEDKLETLLEEMEQAGLTQPAADARLAAVRAALADSMDCPAKDLRLASLAGRLPEPQRLAVNYRRQRIAVLAEKLQHKHLQTAMLLSECARVNRLLLEAMLPEAAQPATYNANGQEVWRPPSGLLDAEL